MIFVSQYRLTRIIKLCFNLGFIVIVETMAFVAKPYSNRYREPK